MRFNPNMLSIFLPFFLVPRVLAAVPDSVDPRSHTHTYSMIDLGNLGRDAGAFSINERGQIVGTSFTPDGGLHAFLWQNGTMTDLGPSRGAIINHRGDIAGTNEPPSGEQRIVLWRDGVATDLGTMGGSRSFPRGFNDREQMVGTTTLASGVVRGFLWQRGAIRVLVAPNGAAFRPSGMNNAGQVVGYYRTASGDHAGIWQNGEVKDLGTFGGTLIDATDINERGQVVGYSQTTNGESHAFLWQNDSILDLGPNTIPIKINNLGQVIGVAYFTADRQFPRAFLWEDGVMTDLGTLEGRQESNARDINDRGQIVGWSRDHSGNQRAVLWDPSHQKTSSLSAAKSTLGGDDAIEHLLLHSVAPNPSSGAVRLVYEVPASNGLLQIRVFDIAGRLVAEPFVGTRGPGTWSTSWNGVDARGRPVPAGVYIVRLEMDGRSVAKRILLTR